MTNNAIAITGGTGFIGSVVTKKLLERGYLVRSLHRPHHKLVPSSPSVKVVTGCLEDVESLKKLVHGTVALINCAGAVRGFSKTDFFKANVDGLKNILKVIKNNDSSPVLVHVSSLAAREPQLSYYSESKLAGESIIKSSGNLTWTIFRPPAVYGPGDQEVLPIFKTTKKGIAPVIGSSNARFSLLYVDDLAEAIISAIEDKCYAYKTFELDDGMINGYSWGNVVEMISCLYEKHIIKLPIPKILLQILAIFNTLISKITRKKPMLTLGKVRELIHINWVCNTAEIISATNWRPQVQLQQGLLKTLI